MNALAAFPPADPVPELMLHAQPATLCLQKWSLVSVILGFPV